MPVSRVSFYSRFQGAFISTGTIDTLSPPTTSLLDGASLFLDFDGTLAELVDRPEDVIADDELRELLVALNLKLDGRLAIVSGRSLAQLDAILGPVAETLALSGSHGSEHRWRGVAAQPVRPASLDAATKRLRVFAGQHAGMILEEKSYGVALHYRQCPDNEPNAMELATHVARDLDLHLQGGKMMVELRVRGGDKGVAVRRLMSRPPMAGTVPVFVGDDLTDETGFEAAVELGGAGVLVGHPRDTAARYRLDDPRAVRAWLAEMVA